MRTLFGISGIKVALRNRVHRHHKRIIQFFQKREKNFGSCLRADSLPAFVPSFLISRITVKGSCAGLLPAGRLPNERSSGFFRPSQKDRYTAWMFNHQVDIQNKTFLYAGFDHHGTDGDVRNKMSVHHIDLDRLCAGPLNEIHVARQISKIRGKSRWARYVF